MINCPIGLDNSPEICSAGNCTVCLTQKIISVLEDLIYEDINQEDYWKAVKEGKLLIKELNKQKEDKTCYCGNYSDRFISTSGSCTICGKKEKKLDIKK